MYTDAEHAMPAEETDPVLGERLESNANALEVPPVWQTTMLACKQISDACRSNAEWAQMWTRGSTCNGISVKRFSDSKQQKRLVPSLRTTCVVELELSGGGAVFACTTDM